MCRIACLLSTAVVGCLLTLMVCGCTLAASAATDSREARAVETLERRAERGYADVAPAVQSCEEDRDVFFDCMVEYVEPYFTRPPRSNRSDLRQLALRVGPDCERWLMAILRGLETKTIFDATAHEDLDAAARACRAEAE
jgi:hypothetical protein